MEQKRIIVRTTSNLSYIGSVSNEDIVIEGGILLKTSPKMDIKIWIPTEEIDCIIEDNVLYTAKEYVKCEILSK